MRRMFRVIPVFAAVAALILGAEAADQSAQYYYDQAKNLEKSGDTIRASDMVRESLRKNGDHVPSLLLLSKILSASLDLKAAEALVQRALKLDAENEEAAILCARIEYKLKNIPAFESCLERAEKKRRTNPDALSLRAQVLIDNAQYAIAKRKIDAILRDNPGHTETHLRLAGLYLKLKQFEKAESQFRKIQVLLPDNSELAVAIARARLDAFFRGSAYGDFSPDSEPAVRALEALRHAYSNNSENSAVSLMLSQLLAATGRCGEAGEYLKKLAGAEAEARSVVIFYAFCDPAAAAKLLADYLKRNEDDDLTRHQAELAQLVQNKKREHAVATKAARYHRNLAKREMEENADEFALAELRWAEFLFPGYIEAHRDLLRFFRTKKDYERMTDELLFLRDATQNREFREQVEQLEIEKRDLWYLKEGVAAPERAKNPVPVHVYPLRARDPLVDHPLGGVAIADRTRVALQNYGRVRSVSREMAALPQAQKFNPENLRKLRQTYTDALKAEENPAPFRRRGLGLVLVGDFSELAHGIEIAAELVDAESGIRVAGIAFKAVGRDFLNKAAVRLAGFVFENSPVSANVLKVQDTDRILINTGKRDKLPKDAQFAAVDKLGRTVVFKTVRREFDILEAKSEQSDATKHLKAGDVVQLVKSEK